MKRLKSLGIALAIAAVAGLFFWHSGNESGHEKISSTAVSPQPDAAESASVDAQPEAPAPELAAADDAAAAAHDPAAQPAADPDGQQAAADPEPRIIVPEANYIVNDPYGVVSPVAKLVANGEELDRRELPPDEQGRPGRLRLVRTEEFKHPYLRVEERFAPYAALPDGPLNPFPELIVSVANHVLVQFDAAMSREQIEERVTQMGGTIDEFTLSPGLVVVELPEATLDAMPEAAAKYPELAEVRFAEANYVVGHLGGVIPNDTHWGYLWGLPKIQAPEAWQITTGSRNVVVAVIDSGVDYTHSDLKENIFYNTAETANGADSDGNGFKDDIRGWDFYDNDNTPMDEHSHGTHVSGTIAAVGNNNLGVVGVSWETRIMPLRFLGKDGSGTTAGGVNCIRYSTMMGVDMSNNSWGGGDFSQSLYDAIQEALEAGILFVAAAGNDGSSNPGYPARYGNPGLPGDVPPLTNILIVAASSNDEGDTLATFSQRNAHLAAPGVGIVSTVLNNDYKSMSGTSMASPHVAGAAALLRAIEPEISHLDIIETLTTYVDDRSSDPEYEYGIHSKGRMNVFQALANLNLPVVVHVDTAFVDKDGPRAGNGVINPGETVDLTLALRSVGAVNASNVSATLSTTSAWITVVQDHKTQTYGNFDRFQTVSNSSPYVLTVATNTPTPYVMPLTLTMNFEDNVGTPYTRERVVNLTVYTSVDISGKVRHLDGTAFEGATVVYAGPFAGSAVTDINGDYDFEMVDGTYTFFADADGYRRSASREYSAPPGTNGLNFVLGNSVITSSVSEVTATVLPGGQVTLTLDLSNLGNLPLDWQLRETEYDFEHVIDAMDTNSATLGESLIPERPELAWKEIRTEYGGEGGRRHDWWELYRPVAANSPDGLLGFDGQKASSGPLMFDFDFPYYGQSFRSARVASDGWLSFDQTSRSFFHDHFSRLPQQKYTPYMIAFQWAIRADGGGDTNAPSHHKPFPPSYEPGWDDTRHAYSKNWDSYSWVFTWNQWGSPFVRTPTEYDTGQMELRSDGSIIMRYLKYEVQPGVTNFTYEGGPVFFQVGMQDGSRTRACSPMFMGYTAYYEDLAPWPGSVLIMHPAVAAGWIQSSQTRGRLSSLEGKTTLTLTLDATQLPEGVFESSIVVDSNDSTGNEALLIPITLTVTNTAAGAAITAPSDDLAVSPGTNLTLTATVTGSVDPAEVTFLNEGVELGSTNIDGGSATWVWNDVPAGFHELRARVTSAGSGHTVYSPIRIVEAGQGLRVRLEFEDQPMQKLGVIDPVSTLFQPPVISANKAFAERFDIKPILFTNETDFTWLGSDSTRDQWGRGEHFGVTTDGTEVRFVDTNYRKYPFSYTITADTVLEFELKINYYADSEYGEHRVGIGLLNANTVDTGRMFRLDYPHRSWGISAFADYTERSSSSPDPTFVKYRIPVGEFYTGAVSWLGFVGHKFDTASGGDSDIAFRNVRIYENSTSGDFTYNWSFNDTDRVATDSEGKRTYFSPGTKEIQVEVSDGFFTNTASRSMEIPGEDTFRVAIDFGKKWWRVSGNIEDNGEAFGDRGNDLWFGWDRDRTADTMDDNIWSYTGMKQTLDRIRAGSGAAWRMKVPNGVYTVTAYVGANYMNNNNLIKFNGEVLIDRNLASHQFAENSLTLDVTDGEIVISSHRNTASITHMHIERVRSVNAVPVAAFTVEPQTGEAALGVTFDASDSFDSDGVIVHYDWDFGDGFSGEGPQLSHTYSQPGIFEVTLTVTDNEGFVGQAFASVVVTGSAQPALLVTPPPMPPPLPPLFGEPQIQPYPSLYEGSADSLQYSIQLATQPAEDVIVSIGSGERVDAVPETLTFTAANWDTPQGVMLTAVDDEIVNGATIETITATASSDDTDYSGKSGAPFKVTVYDNDAYGTLQFTQSSITVDEGIGTFELTVTREGGQSGTLTANWTTVNGTATGGEDFVATNGVLVWAHNETGAKTVTIEIIDDEDPEPAEHFQVQITSATNQYDESVLGSPAAVAVTILDNDNLAPQIVLIAPTNHAVFESGDSVVMTAQVYSATANITQTVFRVNGAVLATLKAPVTNYYDYSVNWTAAYGATHWDVIAYDHNGAVTTSDVHNVTVTAITFGSEGGFLREIFTNITGTTVATLTDADKYPAQPDSFSFIETGTLSYQANVNSYGTRHRAYFVAPKTGHYTFYVAARNRAELWLSTDALPQNAVRIIQTTNDVDPGNWTGNSAQKSAPILLEAGQFYYLEALHKAGTSSTRHIQVGVDLPGGQMARPIPVGLLRPFEGSHLETTTELVRVPEGGTQYFGVRLSHPPYDQVRVDITAEDYIDGGDSITVGGGTPMYFNDSNYDIWQYVSLNAAIDEDAIDGERTIRMTLDNGLYWEITAQEIDAQLNHTPEVEIESPTVSTVNLVDTNSGLYLEAWAWDPDEDELTITWSKESGPGTVTFDDANALDTGARFSEDGEYVLRVTVDDGEFTASDEVTVSINQPAWHFDSIGPSVEDSSFSIDGDGKWLLSGRGAGFHLTTADDFQFAYIEVEGDFEYKAQLTAHNSTGWHYTGIMARDNLTPGSPFLAYRFEFQSNGDLGFVSQAYRRDSQGATSGGSVSGSSAPGSNRWLHVRRIGNQFGVAHSASGTASSWATRTIPMGETVLVGLFINGEDNKTAHSTWGNVSLPLTPQAGTAPQVSAGTNFTVDVNEEIQLDGWAEDDGLPDGTLHTMWRRIAGPAAPLVSHPDDIYTLDPTVIFPAPGDYILRLLATDGPVITYDDITVTANEIDPAPPTITVEPEPQIAPVGGSASFSVTALAYPAASNQWYKVGSPDTSIPGATNTVLTFNPVQESDAGDYYVVVENSEGAVTSVVVSLSILYPPAAPSGLSATTLTHSQIQLNWFDNSDNEAGFEVAYADGTSIATVGADVTTYTVTGLTPQTLYNFKVRAFNDAGNSAWTANASAKTLSKTEEQYRISFGDTVYTADPASNVWQSFRLRETFGTDSPKLEHTNVLLKNTDGADESGIRLSATSTVSNNMGIQDETAVLESFFDNNPFDWFTPSEGAQREVPAFTQNGSYWDYSFSGFAETDEVTFEMVIRRPGTGRNIDLIYNPGESDELKLLDNVDSGVSQYVTRTVTGATNYSFRLTGKVANWVGTINAMSILVESAGGSDKETPTVTAWPTATNELTYGQALAAVLLSEGGPVTNAASEVVEGTFAFANPATVPPAGTADYTVRFFPDDLETYNTVDGLVSVTVNKAVATVTLSNLIQGYNAIPRSPTTQTSPTGLTVDLTYDGSPTAPTAVGSYAVEATIVDENYVGGTNGTLEITKAAITVTADPKAKFEGAEDPVLTYSITSGQLWDGDTLTGSLTREAGEVPGAYDILQGTLAANENYELTFVGALFTITSGEPVIEAEPADATVTEGDSAGFTVAVIGSAPLYYQWRKNGSDIADATNASYNIASTQLGDAGGYDVVITNSVGSVTSRVATLTVNERPPTYNVIYDAGGGTGEVPTDSTDYDPGDTVTVLGTGTLTKEGHAFNGWRDNVATVTYAENDTFLMPARDVTLVAQWTVLGGEGYYLQPFDNTVNRTSLTTLDNWGYAASNGEASTPGSQPRQWGMMSDANGAGGTKGLAYNIAANNPRAFANWFAGDLETPTDAMSLPQDKLLSLSARIGHTTANNQTRWLIRINDDGTGRWFVSLATYTNGVGGVSEFEANNILITANFSDLEWRPLLNPDGDGPFDGLISGDSAGFTIINNAANPEATTLPAGNITALGVYHWHNANDVTRFDDFKVTWGTPGGGYTVTYETGGGTGDVPVDGNLYAAETVVTVMGPGNLTKDGYTFAGWRNNETETTYQPLDTFAMPETNVTLTAQWEEESLQAPATPTGLTADSISSSQINLSWTDPSEPANQAAGFRVERSLDQSDWAVAATPATTSYSDSGLAVHTRYYYRVVATNAAGESAASAVADARTWTIHEFPDDEDDGIDDRWMAKHYPDSSATTEVIRGDHTMTVREIFIAGLDPADSKMLEISAVEMVPGISAMELTFTTVSNRFYDVLYKTNLLDGTGWEELTNNIPGGITGSFTVSDDTDDSAQRFYRIRVKLGVE